MGVKQIEDFDPAITSEATDKLVTQQSDGATRAITIQQIVNTLREIANGIAGLDENLKVIRDPASATITPTPDKIPKARPDGTIDINWLADLAITTTKLADLAVTTAKLADGAVTPEKLSQRQASPGDYLVHVNGDEKSTNSTTYVKLKETKLEFGGTYRIKFSLRRNGGSAYARIYRNGSPVGAERSTDSDTYVEFSEDISGWNAGDLVQVFGKNNVAFRSYVSNLKICASEAFAGGGALIGY